MEKRLFRLLFPFIVERINIFNGRGILVFQYIGALIFQSVLKARDSSVKRRSARFQRRFLRRLKRHFRALYFYLSGEKLSVKFSESYHQHRQVIFLDCVKLLC